MSSGFFTRAPDTFRVPHPRLNPRWIAAVHMGLERAFELIRAEGFDLANAGEDDVTYQLEKIFENYLMRVECKEFDLGFIRSVAREPATSNHDETSIGRKPDLVFKLNRELSLSHNRVQDALFTECKPVDRGHTLSRHYCAVGKRTSGIERFVCGAYASAMEQGLMIAYVRDGFQIVPDLAEALATNEAQNGLGEPSLLTCVIKGNEPACQGLYLSTHQRPFPCKDGTKATPIDLYHSWHGCY